MLVINRGKAKHSSTFVHDLSISAVTLAKMSQSNTLSTLLPTRPAENGAAFMASLLP